jgi:6-phosphogluconolactonase (cycloisomerase 2 family)
MAIVNQDSGTVLASRIDKDNGRLKPSGVFAKVSSPACAVFLSPPGGSKDEEKE